METRKIPETTSASLHIIAMICMLLDHLWATVISGSDWMTCIGRLAFPIFSFMIVEGFIRTRDLKKYVLRLLAAAVLSEIPFNLMASGSVFYPFHQNVLWTFLISIGLMRINEAVRGRTPLLRGLTAAATVLLGYLLGLLTMVDYYHGGVLTVLVFYFFRGQKWWCRAAQFLCLAYINIEMLGGLYYEIPFLGSTLVLHRQALALLALIPIWLYNGRQGHSSPAFRRFCYGFYPVHMLILGLPSLF